MPSARARAEWVVRRGLRIGAVNYRVDEGTSRALLGRVRLAVKNGVLLPVSVYRSLRLLAQGQPMLVAAHPTMLAIGRVMAWLGFEPEPYRFKPAEPKP